MECGDFLAQGDSVVFPLKHILRLAPLDDKQTRSVYLILGLGILVRLGLSLVIPMTNDEAYYWDWGQEPRLSYYDHPPGVSYLTFMGSWLVRTLRSFLFFDSRPWEARFFAPWLFGLGSFFLIKTLLVFCVRSAGSSPSSSSSTQTAPSFAFLAAMNLAWLLNLVPGISLLGCLALPDIGLMAMSAMALYLTVVFVNEKSLTSTSGAVYGACFGFCGLFKYHALLLCGGLGLFLLSARFRKSRQISSPEIGFWIMVLLVGGLVCLPVWVWNHAHGGASILFQLDHGFGGPKFRVATGARLILAQFIILGPWYVVLTFQTLLASRNGFKELTSSTGRPVRDTADFWSSWGASLWAAIPLMIVVLLASFFKEMMPHWLLPAWILLSPLVVFWGIFLRPQGRSRVLIFLKWLWPITVLCLVGLMAHSGIRQNILENLDDDPGALAEITLWQPLAQTVEQMRLKRPYPLNEGLSPKTCPSEPLWAAARWYSVAQLRYHLVGQPKVYSVDPHHNSYYRDRDSRGWPVGCSVWVVAHGPSLDRQKLLDWVDVVEERPLSVPNHRQLPWVVIVGTLRAIPK